MLHTVSALCLMIAGITGLIPVDTRIAWGLVFVAGLLELIGMHAG